MTAVPILPDPVATGGILATVNDFRAILIFTMFLFVSQLVWIGWREFSLARLGRAIDKVSEALWAFRLTVVQDRAESQKEATAAATERETADKERERVADIEKAVSAATGRERKAAGAERSRQGKERRRRLDREDELLTTHKMERAEQTVERNKQGKERKDQTVERREQGVERVEQGKARAERRRDD